MAGEGTAHELAPNLTEHAACGCAVGEPMRKVTNDGLTCRHTFVPASQGGKCVVTGQIDSLSR
ncbi:hypothetical protein PAMC26510_13270 [Caballeronia sordidicola]|uniref:Uncharacterized protein n=1 Tax=Caballeronia sordidicola TaxID=196367 RepID=A0A242MW28_CABSO|nr:hypothetical protein PAMC26510_13270 [Caballeronia sordidicola]